MRRARTGSRTRLINLIVQMGTLRHPDMPDVPSWIDVAKTEDDKKLLWLFGANADIGKSIVAPPGMAAGADRDAAHAPSRRC